MTTNRKIRKAPHTAAEQAALAAQLAAKYPMEIAVASWLALHHRDLTALTKGGVLSWSWAELATVLNRTHIRYQSGKVRADGRLSTGVWTEALLRASVQKARTRDAVAAAARMPKTLEQIAREAAAAVLAEQALAEQAAASEGLGHTPGRAYRGSRAAVAQIAEQAAPPPLPPPSPTPVSSASAFGTGAAGRKDEDEEDGEIDFSNRAEVELRLAQKMAKRAGGS